MVRRCESKQYQRKVFYPFPSTGLRARFRAHLKSVSFQCYKCGVTPRCDANAPSTVCHPPEVSVEVSWVTEVCSAAVTFDNICETFLDPIRTENSNLFITWELEGMHKVNVWLEFFSFVVPAHQVQPNFSLDHILNLPMVSDKTFRAPCPFLPYCEI